MLLRKRIGWPIKTLVVVEGKKRNQHHMGKNQHHNNNDQCPNNKGPNQYSKDLPHNNNNNNNSKDNPPEINKGNLLYLEICEMKEFLNNYQNIAPRWVTNVLRIKDHPTRK